MAMDALDRITKLETSMSYMERDIKEIIELRAHLRRIERYMWIAVGAVGVLQFIARFIPVGN